MVAREPCKLSVLRDGNRIAQLCRNRPNWMHITSLTIKNFRGVKYAEMKDLGTTVIVAGPNGCGKSTIFDAIRLLKTVYGEYQPGEIHQWFNEFQMPQDEFGRVDLIPLLNKRDTPLELRCTIRLHPDERAYLAANGAREISGAIFRPGDFRLAVGVPAEQIRAQQEAANRMVELNLPILMDELEKDDLEIGLTYTPGGDLNLIDSIAASLVFRSYMPRVLGLIDYHSPQRHFQRELVQNLNVNLDAHKQQQKNTALYNYQSKYTNIKSELAAGYVQEVLAERAGTKLNSSTSLTSTLQSLFTTFFPDKSFPGPLPTPQGTLTFPVIGKDGSTHDLNELSAGEKEILYGYLRIRNSAPRYSIVLLDEPELHLNPSLIRKLPKFYSEHLASALDNQIWLITHSDALIRETLGQDEFSLFHMSSALHLDFATNQLSRMEAEEDAEQLVLDLVGDLAAFRPGGKVLIFEGGGESEYDINLVQKLFPEMQERLNCLSGGSKDRVRSLHNTLERAAKSGKIPFEVRSITDWDGDGDGVPPSEKHRFRWDVYHIENYLLQPQFILETLRALDIKKFSNAEDVWNELRECARACVPALVLHELKKRVGEKINSSLNLKSDPRLSPSNGVASALSRSLAKMHDLEQSELSSSALLTLEQRTQSELTADLTSDRWAKTFRGRDVLHEFAHRHGEGLGYVRLRNLIASRMADAKFQPAGMGRILAEVVAS